MYALRSPYIKIYATDGNLFFRFVHTKLKHMLFLIISYDIQGSGAIFFIVVFIKRILSAVRHISIKEGLKKDNSSNNIDFLVLLGKVARQSSVLS